jgi:hypothetical protein
VWQKINTGEAIRVTKGKGKWLKLEVKCCYDFTAGDLDVFLTEANDLREPDLVHGPEEGVIIESISDIVTKDNFKVAEVELKLDRVHRRLQFWAVVKTLHGIYKAKSPEFGAHNNGKIRSGHFQRSDLLFSFLFSFLFIFLTGVPLGEKTRANSQSKPRQSDESGSSPVLSISPSHSDEIVPDPEGQSFLSKWKKRKEKKKANEQSPFRPFL